MAKQRQVKDWLGGGWELGRSYRTQLEIRCALRLLSRLKPIRKLITKEALMSLISNSLKTRELSLYFVFERLNWSRRGVTFYT